MKGEQISNSTTKVILGHNEELVCSECGEMLYEKEPAWVLPQEDGSQTVYCETCNDWVVKGESERNPTKVLKDLVEQLNGIGIPDWHGAEGLDLTDARRIVESEAPNCLFELELKLNSNDETARIEIAGILENLAIRIREGGWDTSFENEERYALGDKPSCGMVGARGMARIIEKE